MPTLVTLRPAHPRLVFTPELEARWRTRLGTDPLLDQFVDQLRARSDAIAALPPVPFRTIPFAEFGLQMLEVSRAILERVTVHGLLYRLSGERRFADRLWREVETALAYPTWNPAHFLDAAEMLLAISFAYDWAFDEWTPAQRTAMREAMRERVMRRGLEIYETRAGLSAFFVTSTANWSSVCNAGLLAGALALAEDEPDLGSRILAHALASLRNPQRGYEPDGASEEGPTYWGYGTDFYCLAALMLKSALGDEAGLLDTRALARTTFYRLHVQAPNGRNFQYADCWPRSGASVAYAFLAERFGPVEAGPHLRRLVRELLPALGQDLGTRLAPLLVLWFPSRRAGPAGAAPALDAFFDGRAQLAMMRSAWGDPPAAYLGFKAGHASHNHSQLDLGSFVFDWAGVRWSTDLGPDSYSLPGYFRSEHNRSNPLNEETRHLPNRWTYFRNNNHGHSTLTLGGDLQAREAVAPFVARGSSPGLAFAVADLSAVYPARAARWQRGAALVQRSGAVIRDELSGLPAGASVRWVLLTEAAATLDADGRGVTLTHEGFTLRVRAVCAPLQVCINLAPALPPTAAENQNEGVTRIVLGWQAMVPEAVLEMHLIPGPVSRAPTPLGPLSAWPQLAVNPAALPGTLPL